MRLLAASALLLAALLAAPGRVALAQAPAPTPIADSFCPLSVSGIAFRQTSAGPEYVFKAYATLGGAAQGPGTISILADDDRYDVAFENAALPLLVRLPSQLVPTDAYISRTGDRHCNPGFVWRNTTDNPIDLETASAKYETLKAAVGSKRAVVPSLAKHEPTPSCDVPNLSAQLVQMAQSLYPVSARGRSEEGVSEVEVVVASDGSVYRAKVQQSSGFDDLDETAERAAEDSTFKPARFRCQNVPSVYRFGIKFTVYQAPMIV